MPTEITMPQQSDTMTEGVVVAWRKKEGDKVKQGDIVAEIETDKATMEMEAFESGTVAALLVKEGQKVPVGAAIAVLATGKENPADVKKQYAGGGKSAATSAKETRSANRATAEPPAAQRQKASASGTTVPDSSNIAVATIEEATRGEIHEPSEIGHGATRTPAQAVPPIPAHGDGNGDRVFATPLAKRIAADKQIDLHQLRGSGPNGRIVQKDVLGFKAPTTAPSAEGGPAVETVRVARQPRVIALTKMRAAIATALQRSKQQIPHFYETIDIDVEELSAMRQRLNDQLEKQNVKLSLADFIAKGVCAALLRNPAVNATFDGTNITRHPDVHLGIAVSVPDGLIVPVLKHADKMGLRESLRADRPIDRAGPLRPPKAG